MAGVIALVLTGGSLVPQQLHSWQLHRQAIALLSAPLSGDVRSDARQCATMSYHLPQLSQVTLLDEALIALLIAARSAPSGLSAQILLLLRLRLRSTYRRSSLEFPRPRRCGTRGSLQPGPLPLHGSGLRYDRTALLLSYGDLNRKSHRRKVSFAWRNLAPAAALLLPDHSGVAFLVRKSHRLRC